MNGMPYHEPVMLSEVLRLLITNPAGIYVDGTVGGGGHSRNILERLNADGRLIGLDVDADAIQCSRTVLRSFDRQVTLLQRSYAELNDVLDELNIDKVAGVLLDLGVSSHQLDMSERGFSYMKDGPLDMRMNGTSEYTAADVVNTMDEAGLKTILKKYGEERRAGPIARAIVKQRRVKPIRTTADIVSIIETVVPKPQRIKSLSRCFQAIRICVNDELGRLEAVLPQIVERLGTGGRAVILSYHSLEDRIVKTFFRRLANPCICPPDLPECVCHKKPSVMLITKQPLVPTKDELNQNIRSRSVKLRAIEKL